MRCLTLADELSRLGHHCVFICRAHPGHLGELIVRRGYQLYLLPVEMLDDHGGDSYRQWLGVRWEDDAQQTQECLSSMEADWLVVDHYALDIRWEQEVAESVGQLMVIDDLANRDHHCDLLLDQNLGRKAIDYEFRVPQGCRLVIGPRYALLRSEFALFRERSLQRREHPEIRRILISLGGGDTTSVTAQVLRALSSSSLDHDTELDIIMGATAANLPEIRERAERLPFKTTVSVNVDDMAERMFLADFSIGAAGSTSWERCCLGLPTALVILAENQRLIGEALSSVGASVLVNLSQISLDLAADINRLSDSVSDLTRIIEISAGLCDGKGAGRVVGKLLSKEAT